MAKVKIGIRKDGPVDPKKSLLGSLVANLTDNTQFANINPTVTVLTSLLLAITAKQDEIAAVKANLGQLQEQLKTLGTQAYDRIVAAAADVQNISNGDTASILSTGFQIAGTAAPIGIPGAPQNLRSRVLDEGSALLDWDKVQGAVSYIIECTQNPGEGPWVFVGGCRRGRRSRPSTCRAERSIGSACGPSARRAKA
jgi:hypothetical protein